MLNNFFSSLALSRTVIQHLEVFDEYVRQGYSVLSVAPCLNCEYVTQLGRHVLNKFDTQDVSLATTSPLDPVPFLSKVFEVAPPRPFVDPVWNLMDANLPQVIILHDFEKLEPAAKNTWLAFLRHWGQTANSYASRTRQPIPPVLWAVTSLDSVAEAPQEEPYFRVHWWWAVLSALDIRMICRHNHTSHDMALSPVDAWREALVPAFVGDDLDLLARLWPVIHRPGAELFSILLSAARDRGWTTDVLKRCGLRDYLQKEHYRQKRFIQRPDGHQAKLWLQGFLYQTPEHGLQVSPAALAQLGLYPRLEHLLWRGQSSLLLPLLDEWRLNICDELTQRHGSDWPCEWADPPTDEAARAVQHTPLATEWGHLELAVRGAPVRLPRDLLDKVQFGRRLRNELAHYHPVSFSDYQKLYSLLLATEATVQ